MNEYTREEFERSYKKIYSSLIKDGISTQHHCVVFLGGQPGTGKSSLAEDDTFLNYININGDTYRKYHPRFKEIVAYDLDKMVNRTQEFVNQCIERLIKEFSNYGYNLVIEGTLRDSQVTINTCQTLKDKGYKTDLYIVAVDAITSWKSTLNRAEVLKDLGLTPRLVPIEKYNYIVNNFSKSVSEIERTKCFDRIHVINRDNKMLYPNSSGRTAAETVEKILDVDKWNKLYPEIEEKFIDIKLDIMQPSKRRKSR